MIRDTPSYGIYFCLYESGKEVLEPGSRQHGCRNPLTLFVSGAHRGWSNTATPVADILRDGMRDLEGGHLDQHLLTASTCIDICQTYDTDANQTRGRQAQSPKLVYEPVNGYCLARITYCATYRLGM